MKSQRKYKNKKGAMNSRKVSQMSAGKKKANRRHQKFE